jgi:hypothetical protein
VAFVNCDPLSLSSVCRITPTNANVLHVSGILWHSFQVCILGQLEVKMGYSLFGLRFHSSLNQTAPLEANFALRNALLKNLQCAVYASVFIRLRIWCIARRRLRNPGCEACSSVLSMMHIGIFTCQLVKQACCETWTFPILFIFLSDLPRKH